MKSRLSDKLVNAAERKKKEKRSSVPLCNRGSSAIVCWGGALAQRGNEPVKARPGSISKSNIPVPLQKAFIPKIRINGGRAVAFSDYGETKSGGGETCGHVLIHARGGSSPVTRTCALDGRFKQR